MCSRYTATADPKTLAERFGVAPAPGLKPRYNVAPGQAAAVVLAIPASRMSLLRWGLLPAWTKVPHAKPQVNARAGQGGRVQKNAASAPLQLRLGGHRGRF